MYIDKLIKRELTTLIISLILIMTIFISVSYASFVVEDQGESNTISVGDIDITFCNSTECNENYSNFGQIIGTEDINGVATPTAIYPYETDAAALESTPYIFNVENTGSLKVFLNAYLEEDLDFVPTGTYENYTSVTTLYSNYVKVGIGECAEGIPDTSNVTITTFGSLTDGNILENISMNVGEDKTYCLWTWLANDTPNAVQSTYFVANINFTAEYQPVVPPWYDLCTLESTDLKCTLISKTSVDDMPYADNISSPYVTAATGINYSSISSDTNGKGLYYTTDESKTENGERVYYFRGAVENNYLIFAGFCWRVVRTVEDGSIRLQYDGTPTDGACPQTGSDVYIANNVPYNELSNDNTYLGYMYGLSGQTTTLQTAAEAYEKTHENTNDSNIKKIIDSWYEGINSSSKNAVCSNCDYSSLGTNSLSHYSSLIADTPYCNERSITNNTYLNKGFGVEPTKYSSHTNYYVDTVNPTLICAQNNDKFTVSPSIGNGALTNPIALLTVNELAYAGGKINTASPNYYLKTSNTYYAMSPCSYNPDGIDYITRLDQNGLFGGTNVSTTLSVIPAISLVSTATVSDGNGAYNDPYIIEANQ